MTSVSLRLKREISVTTSVSPGFIRRNKAPSLGSRSCVRSLTTSVTQLYGETSNFILVGKILFARADTQITFYHIFNCFYRGTVASSGINCLKGSNVREPNKYVGYGCLSTPRISFKRYARQNNTIKK